MSNGEMHMNFGSARGATSTPSVVRLEWERPFSWRKMIGEIFGIRRGRRQLNSRKKSGDFSFSITFELQTMYIVYVEGA